MISLLIPCYNESEVLPLTYQTIAHEAESWGEPIEVVFVDDGSADNTWDIICSLARHDARVRGVRLLRNFGHQAAVGAALEHAGGDAVIVLDADLQDPPSLITDMLAKWREGFRIVYAQRNRRLGESLVKRIAGKAFYRLLSKLNNLSIPCDTGDFALMDASVVRLLVQFKEHSLFWRGLRCWTGFEQVAVRFDRPGRAKGNSKYTLRKLFQLACNGLLSFSAMPLRLGLYLGGLSLAAALLLTLAMGLGCWLRPDGEWFISGTALITLYVGSLQLLCLGVMGEYLNRIYDEARDRPRWLVRETVGRSQAEALDGFVQRKAG
jgi:glycosyltransferase involved in cell wall biosynthesis